ncbi:TerC family protein [Oligella urethralis]|uniref:TerC family protein n=1 Tax=Oligella urethralis TaxID=90245 RepID=UPI00255139C0|nr:TerC family protein [Oligella urethralis]MDK6203569.1 TerC family protein [Oligella urethralis]
MFEFIQMIHWGAVFQIILIDILLGGDNAIIIALACRNLDKHQRIRGILWGTAGAIFLRVILIFFAMSLLLIPYLKIVGALLLLWIGIKLLIPHEEHHEVKASASVWGAVRTILVADLVMSFDNVIAIAGAAQNTADHHQMFYVIFGLLVSVPIIIWGSSLVLKLIDRFPWVVVFGAALLGWIAGGLVVGDVATKNFFFAGKAAPDIVKYSAELIGALLVVGIGLLWARMSKKPKQDA